MSFDWAQDGEPFDAAHGREPAERLVEPFEFGDSACPPRPETGTGSGGATLLEYTIVVSLFQDHGLCTHTLQARSGPGISELQHALHLFYLLTGKAGEGPFRGGIRIQPEGVVKPCS